MTCRRTPLVAPSTVDLRGFYDGVTLTVEDAGDFGGISTGYRSGYFVQPRNRAVPVAGRRRGWTYGGECRLRFASGRL